MFSIDKNASSKSVNQNASSGYTVGTEGLQEKAGTPKEKLDGHHQTSFEGHGHHLG